MPPTTAVWNERPGDTWNVNPIALKRIEKLFCKNERAVIRTKLAETGHLIALVPVAAILVASIRLHFLDNPLNLRYQGPHVIPSDAPFRKGEEMGWFDHGSTIIVFAPDCFVRKRPRGNRHTCWTAADAAALSELGLMELAPVDGDASQFFRDGSAKGVIPHRSHATCQPTPDNQILKLRLPLWTSIGKAEPSP